MSLLRSGPVRVALVVCSLGFVGWSGWTLFRRWEGQAVSVSPVMAAGAFVAALAAMAAVALAWSLLMRGLLPARAPLSVLMAVCAAGALGKYVPGKVGQPVLRLAGVARLGGTAWMVGASMALEVLSWGATGAVVAAGLLAGAGVAQPHLVDRFALPLGIVALAAVVVLASVDQARYPRALRRVLGEHRAGPCLPWSVVALHFGSWLAWALHGLLLVRAVGLVDPSHTLRACAFVVLAPVAGFLALPMPAGVGVRESLMVLGLASAVGGPGALTAALLSRAASLTADVVLWAALSRWRPANPANAACARDA